jgi:hypothetical protein
MSTLHVVYEPREIWTRGSGLILGKLIFFLCFSCTAYARDNARFFSFGGRETDNN